MRQKRQSGQFTCPSWLIAIWLLGVTVLLPDAVAHRPPFDPSPTHPARLETQRVAPDFMLYDQNNQVRTLRQFRGHLVILSFVYTSCPDVCDHLTAKLVSLQQRLTTHTPPPKTVFLTITTDPETDTPAVLNAYAHRMKADLQTWSFLTHSLADLQPVWAAYNLTVSKQLSRLIRTITQSDNSWVVNHTFRTFLIDHDSIIRVIYNGFVWSEDDVLHDIAHLQTLPMQPSQPPLSKRTTP